MYFLFSFKNKEIYLESQTDYFSRIHLFIIIIRFLVRSELKVKFCIRNLLYRFL